MQRRTGTCPEATELVPEPNQNAGTENLCRASPGAQSPNLPVRRFFGKHRAGAENYDRGRGEGLPVPYRNEYGSPAIFEKPSRGRGCGIIPLVTRAHLYTSSAQVPYPSLRRKRQGIRISYDLVGFIPVDEMMKQETA